MSKIFCTFATAINKYLNMGQNDYSRYDFNLFSEEDKRKYRDEHFETDLKNAYELGKRLVKKAEEQE